MSSGSPQEIANNKLNIKLHSGYNLKGAGFLAGDEIFCTFNTRDEKDVKTSTVATGVNPVWNEHFEIELNDIPDEETLFVNVYNKKKVFQNAVIGKLIIPLCLIIEYSDKANIQEEHKVDKKFKLLPRVGDTNYQATGSLHLTLSYSRASPPPSPTKEKSIDYPSLNVHSEFTYQCSNCFQFIQPTTHHVCSEQNAGWKNTNNTTNHNNNSNVSNNIKQVVEPTSKLTMPIQISTPPPTATLPPVISPVRSPPIASFMNHSPEPPINNPIMITNNHPMIPLNLSPPVLSPIINSPPKESPYLLNRSVPNSPPQSRQSPQVTPPLSGNGYPDLISMSPISEQERQLRMLQQIQQKHSNPSLV